MTVGKTSVLVLDCAEPMELAGFYADLLGAEMRVGSDPDFVEVVGNPGVHLAVRRDHGYAPPSWPRPEDSQQAHLRILVEEGDMDEAEREAIGLGARPVDTKDSNSGPRDVRVYTDPAGHSFSLAVYPSFSPERRRSEESVSTDGV
ncbi:VOC family protein [Streptomyces sp. NPDC056452]|uniref:VOC family protein n=1 Tax=Streptomyces sp. NPDC056452 TaxID=3345821 RepID=UPI0036C7E1FC